MTVDQYGDNLKPHVILEYTESVEKTELRTFKLLNSNQEYYVRGTSEEFTEMSRKLSMGSHKGYVSFVETKSVSSSMMITINEMLSILNYEPHNFEPVPELKK